jgi:hypothetical protein
MQGSTFLAVLVIVIGVALMITGVRGTTKDVLKVVSK